MVVVGSVLNASKNQHFKLKTALNPQLNSPLDKLAGLVKQLAEYAV